jgi:hypothetical protein
MILVREVFQLKFGKAKEAKALWKEGAVIVEKAGYAVRALTDLTGPFYTFVVEISFESLADFEKGAQDTLGAEEWSKWYQKFSPLLVSGRREVFTIVE